MTIDQRLSTALSDRYRIERELGQGGMATVYLAEDPKHHRRVAIKVLRPELAAVIGAERFLKEIETTANLQHPHILPLFDSGEVNGTVFYVMPFIDGESLRDRLTREKQLPVSDAVRIATEVASALDYAHRHNVIHRDIKPENILLHDGRALVADFGIALAASKAGGRMTETGMSLGTPTYMSPEQAMGEREISARSDVYALGCVTYEMLIGEPPFTGPTAQAIVAKVMTAEPDSLIQQRKTIPPAVEGAVLTALQKLPADRFATAAEFAAALSGSTTTSSTPIVTRGRAAEPPSRRALWWSSAVVAAVALALGFLLGRRSEASAAVPSQWRGELLGGPQVAMFPSASRDGQLVAFQAMVDGQTQLGVLKPETGDWKVLTSDRSRGVLGTFSWSGDNSKIYFDRILDVPSGVFSISPLGNEPRLVLADAGYPEVLPDGSLLVGRLNADRNLQMYRFWPENGRIDTLDALCPASPGTVFRGLANGSEAVFLGRPASQKDSANHLSVINLVSNRVRRLLPDSANLPVLSVAISHDPRWVVVASPSGGLNRIIAVAADGSGRMQSLASLTSPTFEIDVGPDASLYFDQYTRPTELHWYAPSDHRSESQPIPTLSNRSATTVLPLPDGRTLLSVLSGAGSRVMAIAPGKDAAPFMGTAEQTEGPLALLGKDQVLLRLGTGANQTLAIASVATGQLIHRFPGLNSYSVAGSSDGKIVYYVASAVVWAIPSGGGEPRKIRNGDAVAVDPDGRYLIVEVDDASQVRLFRVPVDGSQESEIEVHSDIRVASGVYLASNAVGRDGRLVLQVAPPSSWFWPAAILDPKTGKLELLPPSTSFDMKGGWSPDGRVVYFALGLQSTLWRFRPATSGAARQ
ncbi:MAG TPA: protein kinase [Gemmatimonadales bacterium]|nr:protein kinase [Gemmatimonadales bacterium]